MGSDGSRIDPEERSEHHEAGSHAADRSRANVQGPDETLLVLSDAIEQIISADSKDTVVETVLDAATDVLGYSQTGIHRYDSDSESLPPVAWSGELEADLGEPPTLGTDSLAYDVYQRAESLSVDDYHDDTGTHVSPEATIRSEVIVPIGQFGVLLSGSTQPNVFSQLDERFLGILCANASAAFDRIERVSRLEKREGEIQRQRETLSDLVATLDSGFETVSTNTDAITELSESIDTDTDRQVETLGEVSDSVEELNVAMETFTERAASTRDTTADAVSSFEAAQEMLEETRETVSEIEQAILRATELFGELQQDVSDIDDVVDIINDIADQTNMLALNAAVEASHTDQDSAGFSVIADEIKSLSEETAENTDQIESIAGTIEDRVEEMSGRMETTTTKTRQSVETIDDVSEQFGTVVERVDETTESVEDIAVEADRRATATQETLEAIQQTERLAASIASRTDEIVDGTAEQSERVAEMDTILRETEATLVDDV